MGFLRAGLRRRAARALDRQLDYQRHKAARLAGGETEAMAGMVLHSQRVREKLARVRPFSETDRVLEVGSGAHGLIFFFGAENAVGVDPLAAHYATLFPAWQRRVPTVAARGESLPFAAASFDVVLCDNVVDHAESPREIVGEIARVLKPGGALYFEVNIHHPFYALASTVHASWRGLGIGPEIGPFADHTVHLTRAAALRLFRGLPLRAVGISDTIPEARRQASSVPARHAGDRLKRVFFKNAQLEILALREPDGA